MLNIINSLRVFFEDCYRRVNVREYAKIARISPPTASKLLASYKAEGLLLEEKYRNYIFYYANKENPVFKDMSRIYWRHVLRELLDFFGKRLTMPTIILFGSLAKAEVKPDSDIDLAVFALQKEIDTSELERKLGRKVQLFWFTSLKGIKSKELANNIINGYALKGRVVL